MTRVEDKHIDIESVVVNGRHRRDMGDLAALKESIGSLGLLHPIVVTEDRRLIVGHRRLEAIRELGWGSVPVRIMDNLSDARELLEAERDENTCRLDMKPSEKVALGKALEQLERPRAEQRKGARTDLQPKGKFPSGSSGKTEDIVGEAVGMSGRTYSRAKAVVEAAQDGDAKAQEAMTQMDATGKVTPAYERAINSTRDRPSAPVEKLKTQRQRDQANAAYQRLSQGLYGLEGTCAGLEEVKVESVLAVATAEELSEWDRLLTKAIKSLNGFHRKLKEEREKA